MACLVNRYKDKVYTSSYLLVKDKYLAEDIFQYAFIKVIENINAGRYNDKWNLSEWLMRIAHNLCLDHFRRIKRRPTIKTSDDRNIFEVINFNEPWADEKIIGLQRHERVQKLLEMLPEDQREVIVMRHYADLSFKEIAKLTNCSINTALGRMRYGLNNLRKVMTEKQLAI